MKYEVLKTKEEVVKILGDWRQLLEHTLFYTPATPECLIATCQESAKEPFVVVAWNDQNKIAAVLPLVWKDSTTLCFPSDALSEWSDLVCRDESMHMEQFFDIFFENIPNKTTVEFKPIHKNSNLIRCLTTYLNEHGELTYQLVKNLPAPYVEFEGTWERYTLSKSSNFRKTSKALFTHMQQLGFQEVVHTSRTYQELDLVRWMLQNNIERHKEKSIFFTIPAQKIVHDVYTNLVSNGELTVTLLLGSQKEVQACTFERISKDMKHTMALQFAYHVKHQEIGMSRYLILSALKRAADRQCQFYDLGRGTSDIKERVKTGTRFALQLIVRKS